MNEVIMENDLIKGLDSLEEKVDVLVAAGEKLKMTSGISASYAAKQDSDLMMIRINAACDRLEASRARGQWHLIGLYILIIGTYIVDLVLDLV
jgi:hypothetical protein|tara:strand:- start:8852 stop:9130 length:279 start_codon:yes stop_codon:yes gene_type:complete